MQPATPHNEITSADFTFGTEVQFMSFLDEMELTDPGGFVDCQSNSCPIGQFFTALNADALDVYQPRLYVEYDKISLRRGSDASGGIEAIELPFPGWLQPISDAITGGITGRVDAYDRDVMNLHEITRVTTWAATRARADRARQ